MAELSQRITDTVVRLKGLTQRSLQDGWHHGLKSLALKEAWDGQTWRQWPLAKGNSRGHVAWGRGQQPLWLFQDIVVPATLNGFEVAGLSLRLGLTWWAEVAKIYVDGSLVQEGDLFDCFTRIGLSDRVSPGETFNIALFLVSPGHDDGALVRSEMIFESLPSAQPEPGFVADELAVLKTYAAALAPEKLETIAAAIAPLDWTQISSQRLFYAELAALRQRLLPLQDWIQQRRIACVGHAHLDLAWLWPVADTWRAAERTFHSVLALQQAFPELTYTHSSPALFAWLEEHQPDLFQQVTEAIKSGWWAIDAGLWVEPELNTVGGESLVRQILYGQRYCQSRFGDKSTVAWLPDSFGFSWQLPQLLHLGGIECFATQKLRWNDTTSFPHGLFWWQGLDGTRLLSLTLPPIGSDIDPVQMATYDAEWAEKTGLADMLWLPGMGDHGGGPTRDMLEKAERWADSPFFPKLTFTSVATHIQQLMTGQNGPAGSPLPIWADELYLELHRGCYTVHADQKWFNRHCEEALREAELFATIGQIQGCFDYPTAALEAAWKQVLFNQFHDILPGTAIPEVFETANTGWQAAHMTASTVRDEAIAAIASSLTYPVSPQPDAIPLVVFNSLNWERTEVAEIALDRLPETGLDWQVLDAETGTSIPTQISACGHLKKTPPGQPKHPQKPQSTLVFPASVPAVGYRLFWLVPQSNPVEKTPLKAQWQLENPFLRAVIDSATGDIQGLWEKTTQQNLVRSPANQLQAFQDAGQYWDAWDIAPDYEQQPLPPPQLQSIQWLEQGPLRQRLRVVRTLGQSMIQQDYVLDAVLPYLKVETVADWHETQVVLKVAFPLAIAVDEATYEIPFGAIARPTQPTDPHQRAKWEVPALRWADMSTETAGLSILTDYKHGFDAKADQLRLTLLKAPLWPDPTADRGRHHFTYALYPHPGDWRQGQTPQHGIGFGTPTQTVCSITAAQAAVSSAAKMTFLAMGTDRVHLSAFKPSEDTPDGYVLRCWELYGQTTTLDLQTVWGELDFQRVNLLEEGMTVPSPAAIAPWQIATAMIRFDADRADQALRSRD